METHPDDDKQLKISAPEPRDIDDYFDKLSILPTTERKTAADNRNDAERFGNAHVTVAGIKVLANGSPMKLRYYTLRHALQPAAKLACLSWRDFDPEDHQTYWESQHDLERCMNLISTIAADEKERIAHQWPTQGPQTILGFAGNSATGCAEKFCDAIRLVTRYKPFSDRVIDEIADIPEFADWEMRDLIKDIATVTAAMEIEYNEAIKEAQPIVPAGRLENTKRKPLTDDEQIVFDAIPLLPKSLTGKQIVKRISNRRPSIDESRVSKICTKTLKDYGVKNRPGAGYYREE